MNPKPRNGESIKLWRIPHLDNIELLHAAYVTQTFTRHFHENFAVGVIEHGALGFSYQGEHVIAPFGSISLAFPGETHDGHAVTSQGWQYRMFYLDISLLEKAYLEISGTKRCLPFFRPGVIHDDYLASIILHLHYSLEGTAYSRLEQESQLLWMLIQLIMRHADKPPTMQSIGKEHESIRRVRTYIHDCYRENMSLTHLSLIAHLSPFHLIRTFRDEVGLPPHRYLMQVRTMEAKRLISRGCSIAHAAYETGFADQSHLTRHFKRIYGMTPGHYSNSVLYTRP